MYDMHAKKKVEISIDQEWTFIINWKKESWFTWYFKNATFHEIYSIGIKWLELALLPLSNSKWSTTYCSSYRYITCYNSWYIIYYNSSLYTTSNKYS
jgi:hypothetical protein